MKEVRLYGQLGRQFGKSHRFDIVTPGEAIKALRANFPEFEQAWLEHSAGYHIFRDFEDVDQGSLDYPFGHEVIRIVPAVSGSGAELAADIIWYAASVYETYPLVAAAVNFIAYAAVSSLLTPTPKSAGPANSPTNNPSYVFNGAINTSAQGNPVPVGYGELMVGSQVISAGLGVAQI